MTETHSPRDPALPPATYAGIDDDVLDTVTHGWTMRQWLEVDATPAQRRTGWAVTWWISLAWKRVYVGGARVPGAGGVLLCPNHTHWIDAWIQALGHTRRPIRYMGKSTLIEDRWIGRYLRSTGTFPVVRGAGDSTAINMAELVLRTGQLLVIYPEGTRDRTRGGGMGVPRRGAARLALATGCQVVPCATWGLQPGTGRGHIPRALRWLPLLRTLTVTAFGEPFSVAVEQDPSMDRVADVRDELWARIGALYEEARAVGEGWGRRGG